MLWRTTLVCLLIAGWAFAQDTSEPEAAAEPTEEQAADTGDEEADLDDFIPTKEVPADEEVTFPVDI